MCLSTEGELVAPHPHDERFETSPRSSDLSAIAGRLELTQRLRSWLVLACGAAIVAVLAWVVTRTDPAPPVESLLPRVVDEPPPVVTTALATSSSAPTLLVHVAGAVARPGLQSLVSGARVADAVAAAGGLTGDADIDRINLAAPVSDGDRVFVPRLGVEEVPAIVGVPAIGAGALTEDQVPGPIDLNSADATALDSLPGVGPATAAAIIAHRELNGPFRSVDGLLDVRGIGPAKLDQIRALVMVSG